METESLPAITIEFAKDGLSVVRHSDNKVLIYVAWANDGEVESVADTLAAHRYGHEADAIRQAMAQRRV